MKATWWLICEARLGLFVRSQTSITSTTPTGYCHCLIAFPLSGNTFSVWRVQQLFSGYLELRQVRVCIMFGFYGTEAFRISSLVYVTII